MAKILFATTAAGVKFYPVTITDAVVHIKGNTQKKLSEILDEIDYSGKADKVASAVSGNFAGLDGNGNLTDSGYKAADFQAAGDYKTVQTAVADPTASGNSVSFIDTISQDTNGVITPTKKTIPNAAASTSGVGGTAGLMSAADKEKLDGIDYSGKADKVASATNGNFAGLDSNGNLTDSGSKAADFATAAQGALADSAVQSVTASDPTTGTDGTITVDGTEVAVKGLGSAAFTASTAYDAAGAADAAEAAAIATVIGESTDAKTADTINGAKAYADDAVATAMTSIAGALVHKGVVNSNSDLPTSNVETGWQYTVATAGTYDGTAMEVGDYLIWNGTGWDKVNGENQVTNEAASLVIGTATTIATVDGTDITVTQVEDMTKIEAVAVADTTEYADVTSLFTAPAVSGE